MPVGSYCRRSVYTVPPEETLRAVAQRMEKEAVGSLVVVEDGRPVGIVTDRDLAVDVVAAGRDPEKTRVREMLRRAPLVIEADERLSEATAVMGRCRVRRLPVVDADGAAVGVISADDVVRLLAEEIAGLAAVAGEQFPVEEGASAEAEAAPRHEARRVEHHRRAVTSLRADTDVRSLAEAMGGEAIGCVVITADEDDAVGIVTDRDIAIRVVAAGRDPEATPASVIMSAPLISADARQPLQEVVEKMRSAGVRRIPILSDGRPTGIVTYDDLLVTFGRELAQLGEAARSEPLIEQLLGQLDRIRDAVAPLGELGSRAGEIGSEAFATVRRELGALRDRILRP